MRNFFLNSFEVVVSVVVALISVAVLICAFKVAFGQGMGMGPAMPARPLIGLVILIAGAVYVMLVGGLFFTVMETYQTAKRTAAAVEKLAAR